MAQTIERDVIETRDTDAENQLVVITPSIDSRAALLEEAKQCVKDQTIPCLHLVAIDSAESPVGPAVLRNFLLDQARQFGFDYVAFLDDDDLIDEDHCEALLHACESDRTDIAFSHYRREGSAPETPRVWQWDDWCWGTMLGGRNLIPVTVVAKLDSLLRAGGFDPVDRYEDYSLWMRMIDQGATISVVPRETWTYRGIDPQRTWLP